MSWEHSSQTGSTLLSAPLRQCVEDVPEDEEGFPNLKGIVGPYNSPVPRQASLTL